MEIPLLTLIIPLLLLNIMWSSHASSHGTGQEKIALIVIDVQNCFTPGGTLAVGEGDQVIDVINELRFKHGEYLDLVVHSQDWHCADHISFASQYQNFSLFQEINLNYSPNGQLCRSPGVDSSHAQDCTEVKYTVPQTLWPDHCVIDTEDAAFHPRLIVESTDVIVQKGYRCHVDSYSAFYDNGGFGQTELQGILKDKNITTVFVTGLARDFCVYFTAKDAKTIGFKTYVVLDATRPVDKVGGEAAVEDLISKDIMVIHSREVEGELQKLTDSDAGCVPAASLLIIFAAVAIQLFI